MLPHMIVFDCRHIEWGVLDTESHITSFMCFSMLHMCLDSMGSPSHNFLCFYLPINHPLMDITSHITYPPNYHNNMDLMDNHLYSHTYELLDHPLYSHNTLLHLHIYEFSYQHINHMNMYLHINVEFHHHKWDKCMLISTYLSYYLRMYLLGTHQYS